MTTTPGPGEPRRAATSGEEDLLRAMLADAEDRNRRLALQLAGMRQALNAAWRALEWMRRRLARHEPDALNAVRPATERAAAALLWQPEPQARKGIRCASPRSVRA